MSDKYTWGYRMKEENKNTYLQDMTSQEIQNSLISDMHMLREGSWIPDWDSIENHIDLIKELYQRTAT